MSNCDDLMHNPFYTHPCSEVKEDHARHIILHQYVGCIKISNTWAIPTNDSEVTVRVPAVVDILVGCCLWNPEFGYLRVSAYDKFGQTVTLQRLERSDSAAPGKAVPMCTKFIITPEPA